MSYAQGTEHYEFPQFVGSDRPTFVDFNAAFRTIDTKLYGLEGDASTVDGRLDTIEAALPVMNAATQSAQNTADSAKAEADTNAEHITALEVLTGQHTTQIANKLDSVAIAEQYDPNAGTYSVDDIVVYNGQRYRCTTQVAVAEPFDADKWTGEDVQVVINELVSDLSDVETEVAGKQDTLASALDYNINGITVVSYGNLVSINTINATYTNVSDAFIPSSDRPSRAYPFSATVFNGTALNPYKGVVNANGSISLYDKDGNSPASSDQCIIGVTYIKG